MRSMPIRAVLLAIGFFMAGWSHASAQITYSKLFCPLNPSPDTMSWVGVGAQLRNGNVSILELSIKVTGSNIIGQWCEGSSEDDFIKIQVSGVIDESSVIINSDNVGTDKIKNDWCVSFHALILNRIPSGDLYGNINYPGTRNSPNAPGCHVESITMINTSSEPAKINALTALAQGDEDFINQDFASALNNYKLAADAGIGIAAHIIAEFYKEGVPEIGIEKNDETMRNWYKRGAATGYKPSSHELFCSRPDVKSAMQDIIIKSWQDPNYNLGKIFSYFYTNGSYIYYKFSIHDILTSTIDDQFKDENFSCVIFGHVDPENIKERPEFEKEGFKKLTEATPLNETFTVTAGAPNSCIISLDASGLSKTYEEKLENCN